MVMSGARESVADALLEAAVAETALSPASVLEIEPEEREAEAVLAV